MNRKYAALDEFSVKGKTIVVLDKRIAPEDYRASKISVDGNVYPYQLTHTDTWIRVETDTKIKGKEIEFVS